MLSPPLLFFIPAVGFFVKGEGGKQRTAIWIVKNKSYRITVKLKVGTETTTTSYYLTPENKAAPFLLLNHFYVCHKGKEWLVVSASK